MSSEIAICVEGVSKCFQIYEHPRDRLKQFFFPRVQKIFSLPKRAYFREFWALKNISFTVRKGESVAIVGRNGSGKSTLLQIICGTLNSSSGIIRTNGRIAALLELGSGFNPEFTGRENVYLNASVLGLSLEEINSKFDEIVSFADIGAFIDQPIKTYSSGMVVRLAFSVQASVDPEILIVDEALAVGDIGFQYKCFQRMEALKRKGVTILMVTHSTSSVLEYADRCIVLDSGEMTNDSNDVLAAVLTYEKGMLSPAEYLPEKSELHFNGKSFDVQQLRTIQSNFRNFDLNEKRFGSSRAIIESVRVFRTGAKSDSDSPAFKCGDELTFKFRLLSSERMENVVLGISLSKAQGGDVWGDNNVFAGHPIRLDLGENYLEYRVRLPLASGEYLLHCGLACFDGDQRDELDQRRPVAKIVFLSTREQVGVVFAPITVLTGETHRAKSKSEQFTLLERGMQ